MLISGLITYLILVGLAIVAVPITMVILRLDKWRDIKAQLFKKGNYLVNLKIYFLDKAGFNYRLWCVFGLLSFFGILDYWDQWSRISSKLESFGLISDADDLVLFVTLLAILIYTIETYRLRDITYVATGAAAKANELKLMPILVPFFRNNRERYNGWVLAVRNEGSGPAIEVGVKISPNPPHFHSAFPIGKYRQEERIFAGKANSGDEKVVKFTFDNNSLESPSYETCFNNPTTIKKYGDEWKKWAEMPWDIEFVYYGVDKKNRFVTYAKKKAGEYIIHDVRIEPISDILE